MKKKQLSRLEKFSLQVYMTAKQIRKEFDVEAKPKPERGVILTLIKGGKKD